jgi:biotin transport system substrate-specific component
MKEIRLLGDYVRLKLKEMNVPITPYILLENILCLILAAKISFHVPFSEVPITLQSLMVVLIGAIYGSRAGLFGVVVYLFLGYVGIPVFSGKDAGIAYMMGTTGGFLMGFVPAVIVAGMFANFEWDRDIKRSFFMLLLAQGIILASGIFWMREVLGVFHSPESIILPLLPGMILKTMIGSILLKMFWNAVMNTDSTKEEIA